MSDESNKRPQSSPEDVESALYGGIPMGRWKEGLLFDGIAPTPGLKSAANWFPRTEKLGPDECRWLFDESGEAKAWDDDAYGVRRLPERTDSCRDSPPLEGTIPFRCS
jgi:hypothetical protein